MKTSDRKHAPSFSGWFLAAAIGLVAVGVAIVIGQLSYSQAGFLGIGIFLLAGVVLGLIWGAPVAPIAETADPKAMLASAADPVVTLAAPAMASPVSAVPAKAAPSAFISDPVADAPLAKPAPAPKPKVAAKPAPKAAAKLAVVKAEVAKPAKAPKVQKPDGPVRLSAPRMGKADDLKEIEGIGPALEKLCHSLGFYHFDQIAGWSDADLAWVDANMKTLKGRIVRDRWIAQSKIIMSEGLEAFRIRAQTNNY